MAAANAVIGSGVIHVKALRNTMAGRSVASPSSLLLRMSPALAYNVSASRLSAAASTSKAFPSLFIRASQQPSGNTAKNVQQSQKKNETRLMSTAIALLPLMLAFVEAELPRAIPMETFRSDWTLSEISLKAFYMIFVCVFSWGAVVFASMNDPYYESDEYRNAGGNGTQHWIYTRAEEEEQEGREELWREELRKQIGDKLDEVKELEEEKQLV